MHLQKILEALNTYDLKGSLYHLSRYLMVINKQKPPVTETNMKIYEIAQAVGYSGSAHFIRAFKTVTGEKPDYYAKRIRTP